MDYEQELGGENDVVWFWNAGERSMGVVQEDAEEGFERASGASRRDGGYLGEKEMVGEDGTVEGDGFDNKTCQGGDIM